LPLGLHSVAQRCLAFAACRPDRYVPLFGASPYDVAQERPDDVPFDEQLRGLERVVKAGKVGPPRSSH
jgi:hypothetical protein